MVLVFAGFLKLILPLIVVIPGIVAFALNADIDKPDQAYPWLIHNFIPNGVKGITFAALVAAIVSSLASMINSISTIFTMDLYRNFHQSASESRLIRVGRLFGAVCLVVAVAITPQLSDLEQAFQFIQEFTGFVSPGALAIFVMGFYWKRAEQRGAIAAAAGSFVFSTLLMSFFPEISFIDRMGIVFLLCVLLIVGFGFIFGGKMNERSIRVDRKLFRTSNAFKILSAVILGILFIIYYIFW